MTKRREHQRYKRNAVSSSCCVFRCLRKKGQITQEPKIAYDIQSPFKGTRNMVTWNTYNITEPSKLSDIFIYLKSSAHCEMFANFRAEILISSYNASISLPFETKDVCEL